MENETLTKEISRLHQEFQKKKSDNISGTEVVLFLGV